MRPIQSFVAAAASIAVLLAAACTPVYAPPIRSHHYGAPARLNAGDIEIAGGATYFGTGGPQVAVALTDRLQLEVGGEFALQRWALGTAGLRATLYAPPPGEPGFLLDTELGAGLGAGGECAFNEQRNSCPEHGRAWHERLAGGGYAGLGLGARYAWFAWSLRGRAQVSRATGIPTTFWYSAMTGPQFTIMDHVMLYAGAGVAGYTNRHDDEFGFLVDAGIGVRWNLFGD
jgi:opacity protein-like surface antigen